MTHLRIHFPIPSTSLDPPGSHDETACGSELCRLGRWQDAVFDYRKVDCPKCLKVSQSMDYDLQVDDLVEDISEAGKQGQVLEIRRVFDSGDHDYGSEYLVKWNDGSQAGYGRRCLKKLR